MSKIPCSVEILTLNSERTIEKCLESVKDFDDVYIVDGNSIDGTVQKAKKLGVSVYKQKDIEEKNIRIENFGEARRHAEQFAKYDWLIYLDSDEYLSPELTKEILTLFERGIDQKGVYTIPYKIIIDGRIVHHSFAYPRYIRLYNRKSGVIWKAKVVHEKLELPQDIKIVPLKNYFYGYVPSYGESIKKDSHYLSLMRKKLTQKYPFSQSPVMLKAFFKNLARALNIFVRSLLVYLRYGFKDSIPPKEMWRYVRYHLIISYYRLLQFIISLT